MDFTMLVVTCPSARVAESIARRLVEFRMAACGNVTRPVTSIYRWKGKVHRESEAMLFLKTRRSLVDACMLSIRALHPYEVPEVLALPIGSGLPAYMRWMQAETRTPPRRRAGR